MCDVTLKPIITQDFLIWLDQVSLIGFREGKRIPANLADQLKMLYDRNHSPDVAFLYIQEKFVF